MRTKERNSNVVWVAGKVVSEKPQFSHEVCGEKFYIFHLEVKRLSENKDIIPILISERERYFNRIKEGIYVYIGGEFRSYNEHKNGQKKLKLNVFVQDLCFIDEKEDINRITLHGTICKEVIYRETPKGLRITDLMLAVNRLNGSSSYIPCIAWNTTAEFASQLEVGDEVKIVGKIQSREYMKKVDENLTEKRIAYEVSIFKIEKL